MSINFTRLTKKEDCDQLIAITQNEKAILEYRKQGLVMQDGNSDAIAAEIELKLQQKRSDYASLQTKIAGMADGVEKLAEMNRLKRLDYEIGTLELRQLKSGVVNAVEIDYDIDSLERRIAGAESFIEGLTNRKNEL